MMKMKRENRLYDMTEGALLPKMIGFTLPFVLANLLQTLYTITDLAVIGQFAGTSALGAVSISGQVTVFMTLVGSSLASGGQIYVAQLVGQGRRNELRFAVGTFFSAVVLAGILVATAGCLLGKHVLTWLNTPSEAMESAWVYLIICCPGLVFLFGYNAICAVLRGMGESRAPTVFIAISAGINVLTDLIFVAGMNMGTAGAALATTLSQITAFVTALLYFRRKREKLHLEIDQTSLRIHGNNLAVIIRLSLPLVFMQASVSLSMLYVSSYINAFGLAAASLAGVGDKLYSVVSMVSSAFSTAMATVVGQNIGARRLDRVKQALVISTGIDLVVFALIAAAVLLFPRGIFRIFTNDEAVLELAPHYLRIAVWTYLFFALMHPALGTINGVGNTALSCLIGIMDGVIARIGLSLLLGSHGGMWGYFTGYCLAGAVSVIMSWAYVLSGRWKKRGVLE